jgi:hypothetical protein
MVRTIGDGGINWNWYLCGDFNEEERTVHVYYYDRWHKYEDRGSKHPRAEWTQTGGIEMMEDAKRVLYGVRVGVVEYLVTNPKYVFDYHDFAHYVPEATDKN